MRVAFRIHPVWFIVITAALAAPLVAQDAATPKPAPAPAPDPAPAPAAPPAADPAPSQPADDALPEVVASSEQAALLNRINQHLAQPTADLDADQVRQRLDRIIDDAARLAAITEPGPLQLHAMSLQMQALHQRIVRQPDAVGVDRDLSQLRAAARRTKAIDQPTAPAIGDFWLVTADLFDINRLALPAEARREQSRQLLEAFVTQHPDGPTADAAKQALAQLNPTEPPTDPAPAPGAITEPGAGANQGAQVPVEDPIDRTRKALAQLNAPPFELGPRRSVDPATGVITHSLRSRYQATDNPLRILEPKQLPPKDQPLTILFVLPVEKGVGGQWGDGLEEVRRADLHNKHHLLVVAPSFSATPWYGDHPTRPEVWQESYMIKAVVPAVDQLYPNDAPRRLLIGFSKSGWGALSLLVRNPQTFSAAASWDAPLMVDSVNQFGMADTFANDRTFARYHLPDKTREQARLLRPSHRIVIAGYDVFRDHGQRYHTLLEQLRIPHTFLDGPQRRHQWDAAWVAQSVDALVNAPEPEPPARQPIPPPPTP